MNSISQIKILRNMENYMLQCSMFTYMHRCFTNIYALVYDTVLLQIQKIVWSNIVIIRQCFRK